MSISNDQNKSKCQYSDNQLQTKEESLKFENSMLEQQLNETRVKKQMEISEIDSR